MTTEKHHVMAFGRMSPPTIGHAKLVDKVKDTAKQFGAGHSVILSHTHDGNKNPLDAKTKLKHAKRFFPDTNITTSDKDSPTYLKQAEKLHKSGVTHLHMVAGSDRIHQYAKDLAHYNGNKKHSLFNFKKIYTHSAGDRDPDAEGVEGMSASKMRAYAKDGNFKEFKKGVPSHVSDKHAKEMFHDVRSGLNLHEEAREPGKFYIPNNDGLTLPRGVMPQIASTDVDKFSNYLKTKHGIDSATTSVPMNKLRPTQIQFSTGKIRKILSNGFNPDKKILISKDNYILDGHHHWLAKFNSDEYSSDDVVQYNVGIHALLPKAREFPSTKFKSVHESLELDEGLHDPGIFKAVFLAGGPGSGKDFILKKVMGNFGFVEVSSDPFLSHLMTQAKLDLKMPDSEAGQRDQVRSRAKQLEQHKKELVIRGRLGIIVNGVADDYNEIAHKKHELESLGYDTFMIGVDVADEVSKYRNIERGNLGGRTVPEHIRAKKWQGANETMREYHNLFGKNFVKIDNSVDVNKAPPAEKAKLESEIQNAFKKLRAFTAVKPSAEPATHWMNLQRSAGHPPSMREDVALDREFEGTFLYEHSAGESGSYRATQSAHVVRRLGVRHGRGKTPGAQWAIHHRASNTATKPPKKPAPKYVSTLRKEAADTFAYDFDTSLALTTPSGSPNTQAAKGWGMGRLRDEENEPKKRKILTKKPISTIIKESAEYIPNRLKNSDDLL